MPIRNNSKFSYYSLNEPQHTNAADKSNEIKNKNNTVNENVLPNESRTLKEIKDAYSGNEWVNVNYQVTNSLFNSKTYTYTANNGSKIVLKNTKDVQIKQNNKTGEIVVIGAVGADIDLSAGAKLSIVDSSAEKVQAKKGGNEIINIIASTVNKVIGEKGVQNVNVTDGSQVELIDVGKGNDNIFLDSEAIVDIIKGGDGDDTVKVYNATVKGKINTDSTFFWGLFSKGNDNVDVKNNSKLEGNVKTGKGNDRINVENSNVNGTINAGKSGDKEVTVTNSTVTDKGKIKTGSDSKITVKGSQIQGSLEVNKNSKNQVNIEQTVVSNTKGLNGKNTQVITADSAVKGLADNAQRTVTPVDTSKGSEYENYKEIKSETVDGASFVTYNLPDGTKIYANDSQGQVLVNNSGDVVLNGLNNASIGYSISGGEITVLNSDVKVLDLNANSIVDFKNCVVDTVRFSGRDDNKKPSINADNTVISLVEADNSGIKIAANNNSSVVKITGASSFDDLVEIELNNSNLGNVDLSDKSAISIVTQDESKNAQIGNIKTEKGNIKIDVSNVNGGDIITTAGTLDINTKANCTFKNINIEGKEGLVQIKLNDTTFEKISSNTMCYIELNNCRAANEMITSSFSDEINLYESELKELNTGRGIIADNLYIDGGYIDILETSGDTAIYGAEINKLKSDGNLALESAKINKINLESTGNNLYVKDSNIDDALSIYDDNVFIDNFGKQVEYNNSSDAKSADKNEALKKLNETEEKRIDGIYEVLEQLSPDELSQIEEKYGSNISKEEAISYLFQNPSENVQQIENMVEQELQNVLKTMEEEQENDENSRGLGGWIAQLWSNDKNEFERIKSQVQSALDSDDIMTKLNAYTLLTENKGDANYIKGVTDSLQYADQLDSEKVNEIIDGLVSLSNVLEYNFTSQDGVIKDGIAFVNAGLDIGTNKNEVLNSLETFRENIEELRNNYASGKLTNVEFAAEYKRLTGNDLNETNVNSIIDSVRTNDKFDNNLEEKIEDYQSTQNAIFQVGEFTVVIAAGTMVTLASGGTAGPAVASALQTLGTTGISLTATTVTLATKIGIEAAERQTNSTITDDMTAEEIAKTAALMYAGCMCGQFGNAVGDIVRSKAPELLANIISSEEMVNIVTKCAGKSLEIMADTTASVAATALITGNGEFNEEFMQNLQSEFIGLLQSKITHAYIKNHPEMTIKTELYNARKSFGELTDNDANAALLKQYGFSDDYINEYSGMSTKEVDALIAAKLLSDGKITLDTSKVSDNSDSETNVINKQNNASSSQTIETKEIEFPTSEEVQQRIEYLTQKHPNMDLVEISKLANSDNIQYSKALELMEKHFVNYSNVSKIIELDDAQYQKAINLADIGIDDGIVADIAKLDDIEFQRAKKLLDKGVKSEIVPTLAKLNDNQCQKAIKLLDKGVQSELVPILAKLDEKQYQNATEILNKGVNEYFINTIAQMDEVQTKRVLEILDKGIAYSDDVSDMSKLDDNQYRKALELLDKGIKPHAVTNIAKLDDIQYKRAAELIDNGIEPYIVSDITKLNDNQYQKFVELIKNNDITSYSDGKNIITDPVIVQKYYSYIVQDIKPEYASVLANINAPDMDASQVVKLFDSMQNIDLTSSSNVSKVFQDYLWNNTDVNLSELSDYIKSIDYDGLCKLSPDFKNYTPEQYLKFYDYHYKNGQITEFTQDDLKLTDDFTAYLMNNYVNADKLTDILTAYPLTSRNVGSLPSGWLENISAENYTATTEKVYQTVNDFQKNKDIDAFTKALSETLGKSVSVKELGTGAYGTGYKISMEGSEDMCLKIFGEDRNKFFEQNPNLNNIHGQHIEVQTGLFVNQHSNDFVKMYFGKVSPINDSDGFLVTQFLSYDTEPVQTGGTNNNKYKIYSNDAFANHNIINGKIIDFGDVHVS